MRAKNGRKEQKHKFSTCRWLKRYFARNTCRRGSVLWNDLSIEEQIAAMQRGEELEREMSRVDVASFWRAFDV